MFQATSKVCPNPAKSTFKVIVVVTRAFLCKDLGMRVLWSQYGLGSECLRSSGRVNAEATFTWTGKYNSGGRDTFLFGLTF